MRSRRIGLGLAGVLAGLGLIVFLVADSSDWGPPGTAAYADYEAVNRLVALPWLLTSIVLAALLRNPPRLGVGLALAGALMTLSGSISEFWVLTDVSYSDPLRGTAFGLFGVGHLVFLIGYPTAWWQSR